MGLGGGVECDAHEGYHLREADLFFEIVDPGTGLPVSLGQTGEIVFTTLTRMAMPLIRYRTGDLARFLADPCPCGTLLPRLGKVRGKLHDMAPIGAGEWVGIADLDEAVFAVPGIVNYHATLDEREGVNHLAIEVYAASGKTPAPDVIHEAVSGVPAIGRAVAAGQLVVDPIRFSAEDWISTGVAKRAIVTVA
jgi:phenylacetate-coenzyme A ligase PaaK-like adenylate-forming protein